MLRSMSRWLLGAVLLVAALACSRAPARRSTATAVAPPSAVPSQTPQAEAAVTSRWVYPLPQGNSLKALWLSPQGDVLAVGAGETFPVGPLRSKPSAFYSSASRTSGLSGAMKRASTLPVDEALLVSRDRGQSWKQVEGGSKAHWRALSGCGRVSLWPWGPTAKYARSRDSGVTWQAGRVPNAPNLRQRPRCWSTARPT